MHTYNWQRATRFIPQHSASLRAIHVLCMYNSLLTSQWLHKLCFCRMRLWKTCHGTSLWNWVFLYFLQTLMLLCWTLKEQTLGPIAVPNLSSHPEREVCEVCKRTLKCASSLTAAGAVRFIPPVSKYSTPISKAFTVAASQLELYSSWDALVINR